MNSVFMDDINLVILEGTIAYEPNVQIRTGKTAHNFLVKQQTHSGSFMYPVVYWEFPESTPYIRENLTQGKYVRIRGHLQTITDNTKDSITVACKVCVDSILFAE